MFVVMYRWRLKPGQERAFADAWARITVLARERCGSDGSALLKADDGTWCAIARWPNRAARTACFDNGPLDADAGQTMRDATAERLPDVEMEMVTDLWGQGPAQLA
jgi:heme-degrading monooxygenase HmoA